MNTAYPHIIEADRELLADASPDVFQALGAYGVAYERSGQAQQAVKQALADLIKIARGSGILKEDISAVAQSEWRRAAALSGRVGAPGA